MIGVETPTLALPFLNHFAHVLVVTDLHAFPFFHFYFTFPSLRNRPD